MRIAEFVKKYKWYLIASVLIYLALSLLLQLAAGDGQDVPFVYQVF